MNRGRRSQVIPRLVGIGNLQTGEGISPVSDVDIIIVDLIVDPLVTFDSKDRGRVWNRGPIRGIGAKGDDLAGPVVSSNVSGLSCAGSGFDVDEIDIRPIKGVVTRGVLVQLNGPGRSPTGGCGSLVRIGGSEIIVQEETAVR